MTDTIILCPNAKLHATSVSLRARGLVLSNVTGKKRSLIVARKPAVRNVVALPKRESAVEAVFTWLTPESKR